MQDNFLGHWAELLTGLIGAGGFGAWLSRRKTNAEGAKAEAEAHAIKTEARHTHFDELMQTIQMLREEVDRLTDRLEQAERDALEAKKASQDCGKREAALKGRIEKLERMLARRGRTAQ